MSTAQSIDNECQSKRLIAALNRLGISISYDGLQRIDFTLTNCLTKRLGEYRVAISNSINKNLLHGSIDNFVCIEDKKSGTGSSHDIILMVFENQKEENDTVAFTSDKDDSDNKRSVDTILEYQKTLPLGHLHLKVRSVSFHFMSLG